MLPARVYVGPPLPPAPGIELQEVAPEPLEPPKRSKADAVMEVVQALSSKVDELLTVRHPTVKEVLDRHEQEVINAKTAELREAARLSERAKWGEWLRGSLTWGLQGCVLAAVYLWGTPNTKDTLVKLLEWLARGDP